jgi:concentrative nucleoside transporter, CNT family
MMLALQSLVGVLVLPVIAWALSEDRRALGLVGAARWVAACLAAQYVLAILLTQLPWTAALFAGLGNAVTALQAAVDAGSQFVFGYLAGAPPPFTPTAPQNGFVIAFRVLPMILVLSALIRLFYHWGVLQFIVQALARALQRTLGLGGPLATASAASVFLGTIEAPMVVRPYLKEMSRGALFAMIVATMATVAGTVMALYASVLSATVPGAAGHLLTASLMNVPAALMLARLMVPAGFNDGPSDAAVVIENPPRSSMDAIVQGSTDGIAIVAGVAAMLLVSVAFVALANSVLALVAEPLGVTITLQRLLGFVFAPLAWLMGIPLAEAPAAGALLGLKLVLNELLAYLELAKTPAAELSQRSRLILTYALCGFANFASLGISIGGLSVMAPERRPDIIALVPKAVLAGTLATMLSGAVIGTLVWN